MIDLDWSRDMPLNEAKVKSRPADQPVVVEPDVIVDREGIALAREDHVVVPVESDLGGPSGLIDNESGDRREVGGLSLLAAEAATDAAGSRR